MYAIGWIRVQDISEFMHIFARIVKWTKLLNSIFVRHFEIYNLVIFLRLSLGN